MCAAGTWSQEDYAWARRTQTCQSDAISPLTLWRHPFVNVEAPLIHDNLPVLCCERQVVQHCVAGLWRHSPVASGHQSVDVHLALFQGILHQHLRQELQRLHQFGTFRPVFIALYLQILHEMFGCLSLLNLNGFIRRFVFEINEDGVVSVHFCKVHVLIYLFWDWVQILLVEEKLH